MYWVDGHCIRQRRPLPDCLYLAYQTGLRHGENDEKQDSSLVKKCGNAVFHTCLLDIRQQLRFPVKLNRSLVLGPSAVITFQERIGDSKNDLSGSEIILI